MWVCFVHAWSAMGGIRVFYKPGSREIGRGGWRSRLGVPSPSPPLSHPDPRAGTGTESRRPSLTSSSPSLALYKSRHQCLRRVVRESKQNRQKVQKHRTRRHFKWPIDTLIDSLTPHLTRWDFGWLIGISNKLLAGCWAYNVFFWHIIYVHDKHIQQNYLLTLFE